MAKLQLLYKSGRPSPYHDPVPRSAPEDVEIANAFPVLLDWSRFLAANSTVAKSVFNSRVTNGVGVGYRYEPLVKTTQGRLASEFNAEITAALDEWREVCEVSGELCASELERLVWRTWDTDGEIFIRKVISNSFDIIPLRLQLIETDMIPFHTGTRWGILRDEWNRPIDYAVYSYDQSNWLKTNREIINIPARFITHLKHIVRPNQTRGLILLHAAITRIADISEFAQSHRLAARGQADLFASINRSPDWVPNEDSGEDQREWNFERLQILDGLLPGESVNFHAPQQPNANATDFLHEEMRQVSAASSAGFSSIAQVFDRSYAAQRLEVVYVSREIDTHRDTFVKRFAYPVMYKEPLDWLFTSNIIRIPAGIDRKTLYKVRIDGPTMPVIDPVKDRQAHRLDQENAWEARPGIIRKLGRNPSDVDAERTADDLQYGPKRKNRE